MNDKKILVVPRKDLFQHKYFNGFVDKTFPLRFGTFQWNERKGIEEDFSLKQIIPYVVLQYEDRVFTYCRNQQCTESRLHDMRSIGIGGHIKHELDDGLYFHNTVQNAMAREFSEEVHVDFVQDGRGSGYSSRPMHIGYINDDANAVGMVHFGIVYRVHLNSYEAQSVKLKENELCNPQWMGWSELSSYKETKENWTRLLFPAILTPQAFVLETT